MADVAAQREARRRKILQNSEERMKRLLGKNSGNSDHDHSSEASSSPPLPDAERNEHEILITQQPEQVHTSPYNLRQRPQRTSSPGVTLSRGSPAPVSRVSSETSSRVKKNEDFMSTVPTSISKKNSCPIGDGTKDAHNAKSLAADSNGDVQADRLKRFDAQSLELLKIVSCVFTAFIARYTLKFGIGIFFIQSIFIPFIVLEVALTYFIHTYLQHIQLPQSRGTMMSAALMLCGIKHEVMETYNKIMSHVTTVTSDFCLYVFSFIIWNLVVT